MSSVAAIVVSYETRDHLARCLASLTDEKARVIVVDNASSDGTAELVRERYPNIELVALERNIGFGAACNVGAKEAEAEDHLLLLNADTAVRPGAIDALSACLSGARVACAAPTLVTESGDVQLSVLRYPGIYASGRPAVTAFPVVVEEERRGARQLVEEYPVGAAVMVRREAFLAVGGFDPGFFHFYEEVDLCRRLREAGWAIHLCPEAVIEHTGGASATPRWVETYVHQLRGHLRYVGKHRGRAAAELARVLLLASLAVRLAYARGEQRRGFRQGFGWLLLANVRDIVREAQQVDPANESLTSGL